MMRSPVNNLMSVLQLLDVEKITDEETRQYVLMLKNVSENLSNVLNNSVSELIQNDTIQIELEEVDFSYSLQKVLRSIHSLIMQSKATIHANFSELPSVTFNPAFLESIFLNLITNSIKYSRPDLEPVITICSGIHEGTRQLTISD